MVNMDTNTENNAGANYLPSTNYSCVSCQISFQTGQEQRAHMKEPWQYVEPHLIKALSTDAVYSVHNVKRRMESLPPVDFDTFLGQDEQKPSTTERPTRKGRRPDSDLEDTDEDEDEESASPFQCLFCNQEFGSDDAGFDANLEHMDAVHGFSIPDPDMTVDLPSFVGYLATEVRIWHECLYCGATKPSTRGIQNHMRDTGHCLLNFDREPELLDFWDDPPDIEDNDGEPSDQSKLTKLSEDEVRFASGKVIASKTAAAAAKKATRRPIPSTSTQRTSPSSSQDVQAAPLGEGPELSSSRQLGRREEMSIVGISAQQRGALILAEKKAQRSEDMARRAREWVYAKGVNSQKFDQNNNQMKWGKQNHKLQPR
jgi:pre-60S factor REI1